MVGFYFSSGAHSDVSVGVKDQLVLAVVTPHASK